MFESLIVVMVVLGGLVILLWVASNALKLELFPDVAKGFGDVVTAPFNVFTEKQRGVAMELEKSSTNLAIVASAPLNVFTAGQKKVAETLQGIADTFKPKEERDPMLRSWAQSLSPEEFEAECAKYGVDPHPEFSEPQILTVQEKAEIRQLFEDPLERRAVLRSEELWA